MTSRGWLPWAGCAASAVAAITRDIAGMTATTQHVQVAALYFPNWHYRTNAQGEVMFGEWVNLQRAGRRRPGDKQPKRSVWGVEEESEPAVMAQKIALASAHGVDVFPFCWYHDAEGPRYLAVLDHPFLGATHRGAVRLVPMWTDHRSLSRDGFDWVTVLLAQRDLRHPIDWWLGGRDVFSLYAVRRLENEMGSVAAARAAFDLMGAATDPAGGVHLNLIDFQLFKDESPTALACAWSADRITSYVGVHCPAVGNILQFPTTAYVQTCSAYFEYWKNTWSHAPVPHWPNTTTRWDPSPRVPPSRSWGHGPVSTLPCAGGELTRRIADRVVRGSSLSCPVAARSARGHDLRLEGMDRRRLLRAGGTDRARVFACHPTAIPGPPRRPMT